MKENVYVLYDRNAGIALKPAMIERNDVIPIRQITDLAKNEQSIINRHPEDFQIVHIATFDLETLEIQAVIPRVVIIANDANPGLRSADTPT